MLTLTDNAQSVIAGIVGASDDSTGIRISGAADDGLAVDVASEALADDTVVEASGARVYLDETATSALDDKVLDAAPTEDGRVSFTILQAE